MYFIIATSDFFLHLEKFISRRKRKVQSIIVPKLKKNVGASIRKGSPQVDDCPN